MYGTRFNVAAIIPSTDLEAYLEALFNCVRKIFEKKSLHIKIIKHRLIIKLIIEFVCKLRDESNEPN